MYKGVKKKKAQLFSLDAVFSVTIFITTIIFLFAIWNVYVSRINQGSSYEEIQLIAFQMTDILVESEGIPKNWESTINNGETPGLQKEYGILDKEKIDAFFLLGEDAIKESFNIERFELKIQLFLINESVLETVGDAFPNKTGQSVSVRRIVQVENETQEMRVILWRADYG